MKPAVLTRDGPRIAAATGSSAQNPGAVWRRFGLSSSLLGNSAKTDPHLASLPRSQRFSLALAELGGWYLILGVFLAGRADLLPAGHALDLRRLALPFQPTDHAAFLRGRFGDRLHNLRPLRALAVSVAYSADFRGRPIVVEVFDLKPLDQDESWKKFGAGVSRLFRGEETPAGTDRTLAEFRQWLLLHADIERKREILNTLDQLVSDGVFALPEMVDELASERTLACIRPSGTPLPDALEAETGTAVLQRFFEGHVEQSLFHSFVSAEADLNNILVSGERLAFEVFPAVQPVPAESNFELIQYSASLAAGDTARAIRMLARMAGGESEPALWKEFSALQPMLKIRLAAPASVTAMENYWRALSATGKNIPLFVHLFHRLASIAGEYNGRIDPTADLFSESLWPVLGRILRYRFGQVATVEKAREWMLGSGLLFFAGARQLGLTLEQVRDSDFALTVDAHQEAGDPVPRRRTLTAIVSASVLVAVLVAALQVGLHADTPAVIFVANVTAALTAVGLFFAVAKIRR